MSADTSSLAIWEGTHLTQKKNDGVEVRQRVNGKK